MNRCSSSASVLRAHSVSQHDCEIYRISQLKELINGIRMQLVVVIDQSDRCSSCCMLLLYVNAFSQITLRASSESATYRHYIFHHDDRRINAPCRFFDRCSQLCRHPRNQGTKVAIGPTPPDSPIKNDAFQLFQTTK